MISYCPTCGKATGYGLKEAIKGNFPKIVPASIEAIQKGSKLCKKCWEESK